MHLGFLSLRHYNPGDGEYPLRRAVVAPFDIDDVEATNRDFARFVEDTGYLTDADRFNSSFVFELLVPPARSAGWGRVGGWVWVS